MKNGKYTFNIIHEAAAVEDAFPDKTHEYSAHSIYELMQTSDKGITIGLEGGWGSGKSTVVNLLKKQLLERDKETLFFLFDAWAHEGDPLRRIFLERLIEEIDPDEKDNELTKLLEEISGCKKTIEVDSKKSTSRLGGLISLSAIFVPLGVAILSGLNYDVVQMPWNAWDNPIYWPFVSGLIFTLAPLWVLLGWLIFGDNKWDIFSSESTEKYTRAVTEDGERTSVEFEDFFTKIMALSIGEEKKFKRALFVIDNLDRVEPEKALSIWSILQTFFQHRSANSINEKSWQSKLWFLIPFDRDGLSKVWSGVENDKANINSSSEEAFLQGDKSTAEDTVVTSFLEKCFQVIAEVPEPVMSAWVEFCTNNIKASLQSWPEAEVEDVIEVFKRYESRLESSPTPRQILSFINRVGLLGIRWGNQMSAEGKALYALLRKNRSEKALRNLLVQGGLPDKYEAIEGEETLKSELAGMLFGVDKTKGVQLLLEPEITSALNSGDSKKIKALIDDHTEAFWIVWKVIRDSSLPSGHVEEHRIAVTKAFCEGVIGNEKRAALSIKQLINEWKKREHKWELDKYDYSESLKALIDVAPERNELLEWLNKKVESLTKTIVDSVGDEKFDSEILINLESLTQLLENEEKPVQRFHYSSLDSNNWKRWKKTSEDQEISISSVLPAKGAIKALAGEIDTANPASDLIKLLKSTLIDVPANSEWGAVADRFSEWLKRPDRTFGNSLAYAFTLDILTRCNQEVRQKINQALNTNEFKQAVQNEDPGRVPNLLVICAKRFKKQLLNSGLGSMIDAYWQAEFDIDKSNAVLTITEDAGLLSILWLLACDTNNKFAIGAIRSGEYLDEICASPDGVLCIDEYSWATEDEIKHFIEKLLEKGGLVKAKDDLIDDPVGYSACLSRVGVYGGRAGEGIVEDALKNLKASQWVEALEADSDLFDCIKEKGNHEYKDGFIEFVKKELKEGSFTPHIWEDYESYHNKLLDEQDVAVILSKYYFSLEEDRLDEKYFRNFSPFLRSTLTSINTDDLMRRIEYWLINAQLSRINWLLETDLKFKGKPKESLASRVNTMLSESAEDEKETLVSLIKAFNIDVEDNEETDP